MGGAGSGERAADRRSWWRGCHSARTAPRPTSAALASALRSFSPFFSFAVRSVASRSMMLHLQLGRPVGGRPVGGRPGGRRAAKFFQSTRAAHLPVTSPFVSKGFRSVTAAAADFMPACIPLPTAVRPELDLLPPQPILSSTEGPMCDTEPTKRQRQIGAVLEPRICDGWMGNPGAGDGHPPLATMPGGMPP